MRLGRSSALVAALFAFALPSTGARALAVSGGGFDQALGCTSVSCGSSQTLELDPSGNPVAPASGNVALDTGALTLSFSLSILELDLSPVGGGTDNGVSEVVFTNTSYQATGLTLMNLSGTYIVGPGQTAQVSGQQTQLAGMTAVGGTLSPFQVDARITGSCTPFAGGVSCGFSFGASGFSFDVGDPTPTTRYFQHTANLTAVPVPEPSTALLLGLALAVAIPATRRPAGHR